MLLNNHKPALRAIKLAHLGTKQNSTANREKFTTQIDVAITKCGDALAIAHANALAQKSHSAKHGRGVR